MLPISIGSGPCYCVDRCYVLIMNINNITIIFIVIIYIFSFAGAADKIEQASFASLPSDT